MEIFVDSTKFLLIQQNIFLGVWAKIWPIRAQLAEDFLEREDAIEPR